VTGDVLVSLDGVLVIRSSEILPTLVERLMVGYYALCLLKNRGAVSAEEVRRWVAQDLLTVLSLLSRASRSLRCS